MTGKGKGGRVKGLRSVKEGGRENGRRKESREKRVGVGGTTRD